MAKPLDYKEIVEAVDDPESIKELAERIVSDTTTSKSKFLQDEAFVGNIARRIIQKEGGFPRHRSYPDWQRSMKSRGRTEKIKCHFYLTKSEHQQMSALVTQMGFPSTKYDRFVNELVCVALQSLRVI